MNAAIRAPRSRLRGVMILSTLLILLLGTGTAAAYWTAQATVQAPATAAKIGLTHELLQAGGTSPLNGTYSAETLTLEGAVSITNTGTREADHIALRVQAAAGSDGAGSSALASALDVRAFPVNSAEECTPQPALPGAAHGPLPSDLTVEHEVPAGATGIVCVQTSLEESALPDLDDLQLELELIPTLVYADAASWRVPAEHPLSVTQSVEAPGVPALEQMACLQDGPWHVELGFTGESTQQDRVRVQYRMFIASADHPLQQIPLTSSATTGEWTVVQMANTSPDLVALAGSKHGGYGNSWVFVEKQYAGQRDWTPVAQGKFRLTPPGHPDPWTAQQVFCGWQE